MQLVNGKNRRLFEKFLYPFLIGRNNTALLMFILSTFVEMENNKQIYGIKVF